MAYKIQYTPQEQYRYPLKKQKAKPVRWGMWLLVAVLVISTIVACKGVPEFLIPGDPVVTKSAVQEMISQMKAGTDAYDAFAVFCKRIIDGEVL